MWPDDLVSLDKSGHPAGRIFAADLPSAHLREMYDYWRGSLGEGPLPHVQAIDPVRFPRRALAWLMVCDVESPPLRFRFRLVGTQIVATMGQDLTGLYADAFPNMEQQVGRFEWCVNNRQPYYTYSPLTFSHKNFLNYHVLSLPFGDNSTHVQKIIFAVHFS